MNEDCSPVTPDLNPKPLREQLIEFLERELVGPDPDPKLVQANGEEIVEGLPPRLRYGAGILFPQQCKIEESERIDPGEHSTVLNVEEADSPPIEIEGQEREAGDADDPIGSTDEVLNMANAFLPSVLGFSAFVETPVAGLRFSVQAGRYQLVRLSSTDKRENPVERRVYHRALVEYSEILTGSVLPKQGAYSEYPVVEGNDQTQLALHIQNRTPASANDQESLFTFSLVNRQVASGQQIEDEKCFFQVELTVASSDHSECFLPYPQAGMRGGHADEQSSRLLFRRQRVFAIGHGCSPAWKTDTPVRVREIRTAVLPKYEVRMIVPTRFPDLDLKMLQFSNELGIGFYEGTLKALCDKYDTWIQQQEFQADTELSGELLKTAKRHIASCRECLRRMRDGLLLLHTDHLAEKAFRLMNRAMLLQQIHYQQKLRTWTPNSKGSLDIEPYCSPNIDQPETWPDWSPQNPEGTRLGSWHPFQIAFVLMSIRSITDPNCRERSLVDLIWFPTGGGKTEAYLGLTAFTLFHRRLRDASHSGTTVLTRYTLRLLTAQQYQRASSLICACERIRQEDEHTLGTDPFTIGLWVGMGLTPNTRTDAVKAFNELYEGKTRQNPFVVLKCPWCGAEMGPVFTGKHTAIRGYRKQRDPSTIAFRCGDPECEFSKQNLPLLVIDEDIYAQPPSLLIGTVDKFAMLPWRPETRFLFGFSEERPVPPPELILQDELHLISGPLGSMVGHYETLVAEFCRTEREGRPIPPKIVASTATISRASEQIHALYGCGPENVFLFPPQCLDVEDSFFAQIDRANPGRLFVGVHATGVSSYTTAQVRVLAALLQGTKSASVRNEQERDPYWTLVGYFGSLRELGMASTLAQTYIQEYLHTIWSRHRISTDGDLERRRFIRKLIELTSRVSSYEISDALHSLDVAYPADGPKIPIDLCVATNMISVGIDIQRLGSMVVVGQPKTTSEYIQATSRIGRSRQGPGLIITIYNPARPRDRSHYEHFQAYHAALYRYVEPTSVTPFCAPVRDRGLHAQIVALVRFFGTSANRETPQPMPSAELLEKVERVISERVQAIDPSELKPTMRLFRERIKEWESRYPPKYGDFYPTRDPMLMYPAGSPPPDEWGLEAWPTLTSLRHVDATCEAQVLSRYPTEDEESEL